MKLDNDGIYFVDEKTGKKHTLLSSKGGFADDEKETLTVLFDKLRDNFHNLNPDSAAVASEENLSEIRKRFPKEEYYVLEPIYNQQQNEILEDCARSDLLISTTVDKLNFAVVGKHGKTVLDTDLELDDKKGKQDLIKQIQSDVKFNAAKSIIDKLNRSPNIDFHNLQYALEKNRVIYGRSAALVVKDKITKEPKLIVMLDSQRLGRVVVSRKSRTVVAVEYLSGDEENNQDTADKGVDVFGDLYVNDSPRDRFIDANHLLYYPNKAGEAYTNSKYLGYSMLEPIIHLSMVKRIVTNEDMKEAVKTMYAGVVIGKADINIGLSFIKKFINDIKNAGRWFIHKIPIEWTPIQVPVKLESFTSIIDLCNREILRAFGIPSFLVGYEQIANYANSEQILLALKEIDIISYRTRLKDFIQQQYLQPLFIDTVVNQELGIKSYLYQQYELNGKDTNLEMIVNNYNSLSGYDLKRTITKSKLLSDTSDIALSNVKITYEYHDINFSTKLELAVMFRYIREGMKIPIPTDAVLTHLGLDDYIEETQQEEERLRIEQQRSQQQQEDIAPKDDGFTEDINVSRLKKTGNIAKPSAYGAVGQTELNDFRKDLIKRLKKEISAKQNDTSG